MLVEPRPPHARTLLPGCSIAASACQRRAHQAEVAAMAARQQFDDG